MSSNYTLNTNKTYLKQVYSESHVISRPASTSFTQYTYPIQYQSSSYTPMVLAYYSVNGGQRFPCVTQYNNNAFAPDGALATLGVEPGIVLIGAVGNSADGTTYSIAVDFYVLLNSVLEA